MTNVLIVGDAFPMPDRNSADFRLWNFMCMLGEKASLFFCCVGEKRQNEEIGMESAKAYRQALIRQGIGVLDGGLRRALRDRRFDAVMFEWYFTARPLIWEVRTWQPWARVLVDTVDVVFNRFEAKARLTKSSADVAKAAETKSSELSTYDSADVAVTVTDADAAILHRENPRIATFTVPNIHPLESPVSIAAAHDRELVFVGSFTHDPNRDAMLYFCGEVLPLIHAAEPEVRLRIIGHAPTPEISRLASDRIEVLGYVPDTRPLFNMSTVSIAPLRFGGGMKGKIGEAMSFGLPVVTTSIGTEGFGLEPGKHVLVGDSPSAFADGVIGLLRDPDYRDRVRMAGWQFIRDNYSDAALRQRVHALLGQLHTYPVKRTGAVPIFMRKARDVWDRRVAWRLR